MYIRAKCKTCGESGILNIGDAITTLDGAREFLANYKGSQCPWGGHFEIEGIKFELQGEVTQEELEAKGVVTTDEGFIAKLKEQGYDVYTTDELYGLDFEVTGFTGWADMCHGKIISTGEKVDILFTQSPSNKRLYYCEAGKLQPKPAAVEEG